MFYPGTVLREKYEAFKRLLEHDRSAHDHLAALEDVYYNHRRVDFQAIVKTYGRFAESVSGMVESLLTMCPSDYWSLRDYFKKFDFYVRFMLAPPEFEFSPPFVVGLDTEACLDAAIAGKKAAVLSRLNQELHLPVPRGFVITTRAFQYFLEANDLREPVNEKLAVLDIHDPVSLEKSSNEIEQMILSAPVPREIEIEINRFLNPLKSKSSGQEKQDRFRLALRSSAVKEDGHSSFAGQYLSLMNLAPSGVAEAYKRIIASKYSARALFYRISSGIPDHETPMAVLALEMKDSEAAGVVYTLDTKTPGSGKLVIHSVWGQGGFLVDGRVSPDVIRVDKKNLILDVKVEVQEREMILDPGKGTRIIETEPDRQGRLSLEEADALTLARWGSEIEEYFKGPQDMEWCRDRSGSLFVLQSRPLGLQQTDPGTLEVEAPVIRETPVCSGGETVCRGTAFGPVYYLKNAKDLKNIPDKSIVAASHALPGFVTALHKMAGILIQTGSSAGHFASIAREFRVPAMVNPDRGFHDLEIGQVVTLDATRCRIYQGEINALKRGMGPADDLFKDSSFMDKMRYVITFCAELRLTDPESAQFKPEGCRSLHDIIRFVHETAMKEMFFQGQRKGARKKGARQLVSGIPMLLYVLDVGSGKETGLKSLPAKEQSLGLEHVESVPMKAMLKGLAHPGISWEEARHFDWEEYDRIVMAGGIISADSPQFGSYAVVSKTYMNLSLRFGYHFVILDSICSHDREGNHILFRFSGGGGNPEGRWLRAGFIGRVLERLGFFVEIKSDLIDAGLRRADRETMKKTLDLTGRLLGATKLMDMYLKDDKDIESKADEFMKGRYDFRPRNRALSEEKRD